MHKLKNDYADKPFYQTYGAIINERLNPFLLSESFKESSGIRQRIFLFLLALAYAL